MKEKPREGDGINDAYLALFGTLFGGVGFKLIERWLGRSDRKDTTASSIRTELRLDLSETRVEMERLRREAEESDRAVDQWRDQYYALLAAIARGDGDAVNKHIGRNRRGGGA